MIVEMVWKDASNPGCHIHNVRNSSSIQAIEIFRRFLATKKTEI